MKDNQYDSQEWKVRIDPESHLAKCQMGVHTQRWFGEASINPRLRAITTEGPNTSTVRPSKTIGGKEISTSIQENYSKCRSPPEKQ